MTNELKLDTKSGENWDVKYDSGQFDHCEFCSNQVPLAKIPRMEETLEQNATPAEIQAWNRQLPRLGPGGSRLERDCKLAFFAHPCPGFHGILDRTELWQSLLKDFKYKNNKIITWT